MHRKFFQKSIKIISPFLTYLRVKSHTIYDAQEDTHKKKISALRFQYLNSSQEIKSTRITYDFHFTTLMVNSLLMMVAALLTLSKSS